MILSRQIMSKKKHKREYYLPIKNNDKIKKVGNKLIEAPYSPSQNYMIQCTINSHNNRRCEWVKTVNIDIRT